MSTPATPQSLDLQWDRWADGRVWRLKRGRDYDVESRQLVRAARLAADAMGKVVRTSVDDIPLWRRWDSSLWVQFLDAEVPEGQPCLCGGTELVRLHPRVARCTACGSRLALLDPLVPDELLDQDPDDAEDEDVEARSDETSIAAPPRLTGRAALRRKDDERFGLREYSRIHWLRREQRHSRGRSYATAVDPFGIACLIFVDYPAGLSEAVEDQAGMLPAGHRVFRWPAAPFPALIDLRVMEAGEPVSPPRRPGAPDKTEAREHLHLGNYTDVTFVVREQLPGRDRFFGHGIDPYGVAALVFVDYPVEAGARIEDPDDPAAFVHRVYRWPVEPYGSIIDLSRLEP